MAKAGYKRKAWLWHGFSRELVKVFEIECGIYKPKAYFNLGFALHKKLGPFQPQISECLVHGRLDILAQGLSSLCDFSQPSSDIEAQINKIAEIVGDIALPFMNSFEYVSDLRQAYLSGKLVGFRVPQKTRSIVSGFST